MKYFTNLIGNVLGILFVEAWMLLIGWMLIHQ